MPRNSSAKHGQILLSGGSPEMFVILLARGGFGMMDLLHRIHAAVGFCQQAFHVGAIFRTEGHADAERDDVASADMPSGLDRGLVQAIGLVFGSLVNETWSSNHERVHAQ